MRKIAFLYPGQGAQKCGMGQDFCENSETANALFDKASEILGFDMKALCFTENEQLNQTEYTQAAMVTTCLAMTKVLTERGIVPQGAAGLSLGEYCAIAACGGMTAEEAIMTVRQRGILMQEAVPTGVGAMAAVLGLTGEQIEAAIQGMEGVSVANYNCPGQIVITGLAQAVADASLKCQEAGAKRVVPLNVSGPFHSAMLSEAGRQLGETLDKVAWTALQIPYYTNVTAQSVTDIHETKELLMKQVASSVRWEQSIRNMIADGFDTFIEIGPGRTLTGFMKKIDKDVTMMNVESWADLEKIV